MSCPLTASRGVKGNERFLELLVGKNILEKEGTQLEADEIYLILKSTRGHDPTRSHSQSNKTLYNIFNILSNSNKLRKTSHTKEMSD